MDVKDKRPIKAFLILIVGAYILYFFMTWLEPHLKPVICDYMTMFERMEKEPYYRILWFLGEGSDPHFHKAIFGGVFSAIAGVIAFIADKKNKRIGMPIGYGSGIWNWIFFASLLSLVISNLLFAGLRFDGDAYICTFIPYVSVAGAVVLVYGSGFATALTGAICGGIIVPTLGFLFRYGFILPNVLPGVVGATAAMGLGAMFTFELCKIAPWMKKVPYPDRGQNAYMGPTLEEKRANPTKWFFRRLLADFSEPFFAGNEFVGLMLILGSVLTWLLNPAHVCYGITQIFPQVLLTQFLTSAICMFVYWPTKIKDDAFPTFISVVSVAPAAVITYSGSMFVVIFAAICGALFTPAVAFMLSRNMPEHWHPVIPNVLSMSFCSLFVGLMVKYLIMAFPVLG